MGIVEQLKPQSNLDKKMKKIKPSEHYIINI